MRTTKSTTHGIRLLVVISAVRLITSPEFGQIHNKAHVYIFKSAAAGILFILCLALAAVARKQSQAGKSER